jgi:hypothetical protein
MSDRTENATAVERPNATNRPRATTGETVTVACRMPNGVVLHVDEFVDVRITSPGGTETVKMARPVRGESIVLNGYAVSVADIQAGRASGQVIAGGFGLTSGVPKDFWDAWLVQNQNTDLVLRGIVFASKNNGAAQATAIERSGEVKSGLEPMDPDNLPPGLSRRRMPGGEVTGIQSMTRGDDADNL